MSSTAPRPDVRAIEMADVSPEAWDALAVRSARGEALQSHAWGAFKAGAGWRIGRYRIEDAGGPVAVVSVQERPVAGPVTRRLPGPVRAVVPVETAAGRFLYAPFGPVLLRDDPGAVRATLAGLERIARARRAALLVVDPAWEQGSPLEIALLGAGFTPARRQIQVSRTGMLLPLDRDEAAQRARSNENTRRNVEKARKAGVEIVRVDRDSDPEELTRALAVAYRMLVETGARTGFTPRPEAYHSAASRVLIEAGAASLWFSRLDGRDIAHTLVHHSGSRAILFQAGEGDVEQKRVPGNFLLQWTIIRWAAEAGFATYDLGGVDTHTAIGLPQDEGHPLWNLYRFKLQWGSRPVTFVGSHELAPNRLLGGALRAAWRLGDRRRGNDTPPAGA
jgi:lipid II:glycine glycyltransferase (peptidoglycan interpeptide bridge formation enzyme)